MKKEYKEPEIIVIEIDSEDIISTSVENGLPEMPIDNNG